MRMLRCYLYYGLFTSCLGTIRNRSKYFVFSLYYINKFNTKPYTYTEDKKSFDSYEFLQNPSKLYGHTFFIMKCLYYILFLKLLTCKHLSNNTISNKLTYYVKC